ncbi:MAG: cytochrome c [Acidobacteria bacterium]|nr:cytochrome c [Acidobacteriota bacterium]MBV9145855.1 cytochrome c [Acidobacteriota bacterium]MBV9435219.1 cytochrome c [Acidobacteriota bacterium]
MKYYRLIVICILTTALSGMVAAQSAADLYKGKCQGCHGVDGHASPIGKKLGAKDFNDPDVAKMSQADIVRITTEGRNRMPAYKGKLTEQQIRELAKYVKEMK